MITTWPESVKGLSTARGAAGEQVSGLRCRSLPQPTVIRSPRGCRMAAVGAQPSRRCVCGTRGDEGLLQSRPPGPELQSRCPTMEGTPRPGAKVLPGAPLILLPFCLMQAFNGLYDAHPHWGRQTTLLSLLIEILFSSGNTLTGTPRRKCLAKYWASCDLVKLTHKTNHHTRYSGILYW